MNGLRVTSGTLRGRRIPVPKNQVRPTSERARQAADKYEMARDLWSEVGDKYEEGLALCGAGSFRRLSGANQAAIAVYERALELMREAQDS